MTRNVHSFPSVVTLRGCPPPCKSISKTIKIPYITSSKMLSTRKYHILYDAQRNPHEINTLHLAFKNMLFLFVEHALLGARRACSRLLKGVFFNGEGSVVEKREA